MIRNVAREIAMHLCYELSFTGLAAGELLEQRLASPYFESLASEYEVYGELPGPSQKAYICKLVKGIAAHGYELDQYIEKYAKGWRFERIPLVAGAIMRLAMYEILYMPEIPNGAAINEAVEIAKKEGADFILGSDPDADRVGLMVNTGNGEFKVLTGNQTGVLLLDYLIGAMKRVGNARPERAGEPVPW